jgi:AcrR family transcriptional regulator
MTARAEAAAATGERVLAAAWRHFAERPYEEVVLREVAADAHVTPQTLHARFGSKEQLFTAAYAWFGRQELAERPAAPTADVPRAVAQLYERYEQHGRAVLRMLSQEERIPAVRRMTDAGREYHRHWARTTFAPLLRGLRGPAREQRAVAITVATDLLVWKLLRLDVGLEREEAERVVVELVGRPGGA